MRIAMVILAAGFSKRMGVFKPLLPIGEKPAVLRCADAANAAGVSEVIVVTGHCRDEINAALCTAHNVRLVHNSMYSDGMFSSVYAGVRSLSGDMDGFFLQPADCAAVSATDLAALTDEFAKNGRESVTRPRFGDRRGHPPLIPACFAKSLLTYDGADGLKGFLRNLPTVEVEMDTSGVLLDMDTPDDYADLLAYLKLPAYPNRDESFKLLEKYNAPPDVTEHCTEVAAVALRIARLINGQNRGAYLDLGLLESACLLHDIKRAEPEHAVRGMELLLREGYPKAAILVGSHTDIKSAVTTVGELELLYLADKLCRRGEIVKLEDTLRNLSSKFSSDREAFACAKLRIENAQGILSLLQDRHGIGFEAILN